MLHGILSTRPPPTVLDSRTTTPSFGSLPRPAARRPPSTDPGRLTRPTAPTASAARTAGHLHALPRASSHAGRGIERTPRHLWTATPTANVGAFPPPPLPGNEVARGPPLLADRGAAPALGAFRPPAPILPCAATTPPVPLQQGTPCGGATTTLAAFGALRTATVLLRASGPAPPRQVAKSDASPRPAPSAPPPSDHSARESPPDPTPPVASDPPVAAAALPVAPPAADPSDTPEPAPLPAGGGTPTLRPPSSRVPTRLSLLSPHPSASAVTPSSSSALLLSRPPTARRRGLRCRPGGPPCHPSRGLAGPTRLRVGHPCVHWLYRPPVPEAFLTGPAPHSVVALTAAH